MKSPPKPDARDVPASAAASVHTNGDATGIGYSARALIACGLGNAQASESRIGCRRVPARLLKRSSKRDFLVDCAACARTVGHSTGTAIVTGMFVLPAAA